MLGSQAASLCPAFRSTDRKPAALGGSGPGARLPGGKPERPATQRASSAPWLLAAGCAKSAVFRGWPCPLHAAADSSGSRSGDSRARQSHLQGQLAGGRDDQRAQPIQLRPALAVQCLHHRQQEGQRLACRRVGHKGSAGWSYWGMQGLGTVRCFSLSAEVHRAGHRRLQGRAQAIAARVGTRGVGEAHPSPSWRRPARRARTAHAAARPAGWL